MSQFIFPVNLERHCMVGWDSPLETFFGQVYLVDSDGERIDETPEGESGTLVWVGTNPAEIRTVEDLEDRLRGHAKLPQAIRDKLLKVQYD